MATPDKRDRATSPSLLQASDEDYTLVCLPCHRDDSTTPAFGYCSDCNEHLCHICYKHHRKATLLRNHKLLDKDEMPSTQQLTDSTVHAGTNDNLTTPCPRHKTEMLKLYCQDHDLLLCSICVALEHTKPCHVDYIPDISDKMIDSPGYKDTIDSMEGLLKKCTTIQTETSADITKSTDSLKNVLLDIKKYRQETNKRIDELQQEIETKIEALQQQNDDRLKTVETICEDVQKMMKVTYNNIKQLNSSKQANELFKEVKQAKKQLQDYEDTISSIPAYDCIDDYKFIPNQAISDVLQKQKTIGDIATKHQAMSKSASQSEPEATSTYDNITPTYEGEICVTTSEDKNRCGISSMTVLPPDSLVLADNNNNSIKLVDVNSKSITSQLSLGMMNEDKPLDITSTTSTQVAVTVPGRQQIQFITVSDKLNMAGAIQTSGYCYGICCHENKLVVTYCRPWKLEILDMTGKVITRVKTNLSGRDLFNQPQRVKADSSYIYASDNKYSEVIMLTWKGEIRGRFGGLQRTAGLPAASLGDRSLLVCRSNSIEICQVSGSKAVLQDVRCPTAASMEHGGHKLYVSRCTDQDDQIDNNILVYNI